MNDQLEGAPVAQPDGREVADISCREATDAEIFSERHKGGIDEAQAEMAVAPVNLHGPRELIERRRGVGKCPTREVVHERVHRRPLVAKEVIDFRQDQTRNVSRPRPVDSESKTLMVRRAFDDVVEQRAGIADQRGRADDGQPTARARRRARTTSVRFPHFSAWDGGGTARERASVAVE